MVENQGEERTRKLVYKTDNATWKCVQLYKIHANKQYVENALDDLIKLGWEKYKENEENGHKEL